MTYISSRCDLAGLSKARGSSIYYQRYQIARLWKFSNLGLMRQGRVRKMRASLLAAAALWVAALCAVGVATTHEDQFECLGTSDAIAALQSNVNVSVEHTEGVGYAFVISPAVVISLAIPGYVGGPNLTRGVVILPEDNVAPEAYVPLARELALSGSYAVVVEKATPGRVLRAMMQNPLLEFWTLVGHGSGGALAAHLALTLQPKVKALILLAAPMPTDVDMAGLNIYVVALYGHKDTVVTPATVEESFSRMPGDAAATAFPHLGHYDFAKSQCVDQGRLTEKDLATISGTIFLAILNNQWAAATEKALSFSDNKRLTPGLNISKPYPGHIRVHCSQVPIPDSTPQRSWWVFTPTEIKGGLVYYPGASVDARAYFPIAFEIAARGHLVVIVEIQLRAAPSHFEEANKVIDSTLPIFSGVPKEKWAVGGHSFGGQATSVYVGVFGYKIYAAVMHAGLWAVNLTENPLPIAQIYGTNDALIGDHTHYKSNFIDPPPKGVGPLVNLKTTKFITIEGANHFQTGDYGYQKPDEIATISMEKQVADFAKATVAFLDNVDSKL